jgi:hypothetical protein
MLNRQRFFTMSLALIICSACMNEDSMAENKKEEATSLSDGTCLNEKILLKKQIMALNGDQQAALDVSAHYSICMESKIESLFWLKYLADKGDDKMAIEYAMEASSIKKEDIHKSGQLYLGNIIKKNGSLSERARRLNIELFDNKKYNN